MRLTIICEANSRLDLHKGASAAVADFLGARGDLASNSLTSLISWRLDGSPDADELLPRDVAVVAPD